MIGVVWSTFFLCFLSFVEYPVLTHATRCCPLSLSSLHVSETALNHRQDSIRFCLKAVSPQRLGERSGVAAGVNTDGFALSSTSLSAPPLASRMRISGSDSKTEGIEPRSNIPCAWVRSRWDETGAEGNGRRKLGNPQDIVSVR